VTRIAVLDELIVRNLGIIEIASMKPGSGLVVVTGETGAGKTMLVGALQLLAGDQARSEIVGSEGDAAVVEGRFVGEEEIAIRRQVSRESRSRAYLNGEIATVATLRDRMKDLVDVVAQGDSIALRKDSVIRTILDGVVAAADEKPLDDYRTAWDVLATVEASRRQLGGDSRALERERELVAFQVKEIESANFAPGDDAVLIARAGRLRHVEELSEFLGGSRSMLESAGEALGEAVGFLRKAVELDPSVSVGTAEELQSLASELSAELRSNLDDLPHDTAELEMVDQRLSLLSALKRKYGADLDEVLAFGRKASQRLDQLAHLLDRADEVEADYITALHDVEKVGGRLTDARRRAAAVVEKDTVGHLRDLGFSTPQLEFSFAPRTPFASGCDRIELLFASDERLTVGPIGRVASGGELSRLVLALRLAAGADDVPVVVFDEIDAGVGGATALALGEKLAELAKTRQVLCVTHLPQVAAFADDHFVVRREGANAKVVKLNEEEQLEELSRMLAGLTASERGREHARELLERATVRKREQVSPL
jgi:DNA repair protein RecN (Recombination protein N)